MTQPAPLHLSRIDPTRNMRRFYTLQVQPTLFGSASLLRVWGRIGTRGQAKVETFASVQQAAAAFERLERAKRRKGYRNVQGHAEGSLKETGRGGAGFVVAASEPNRSSDATWRQAPDAPTSRA